MGFGKTFVQITAWTPEEVERWSVHLISFALNVSKNDKEYKSIRKAAKLLLKAFEDKDLDSLNEIIRLTSKLNKNNLFYINISSNIKTLSVPDKVNEKRRYIGGLLIIPKELWRDDKHEERDAYIKRYKLSSSERSLDNKSSSKVHGKDPPRRDNPGASP